MTFEDRDERGSDERPKADRLRTRSLWDTLEAEGSYSRFLEGARAAGLENTLRGPGFLTVFAVADGAMGDLNKEALRAAVSQHIVHGMQKVADLRTAKQVRSLGGTPVPVSRQGIDMQFGDTKLIRTDLACTNGMIHVVDKLVREYPKAS
jgi:uncharacterized surface protein with fasciclin (FAS1) repeats